MGYKEVEMCSPLGYKGTFDKFDKYSGAELRKIIEDQGLKCTSSHYTLNELRDGIGKTIEWTQQMGIKQMALSTFWLAKDASVDEYRKSFVWLLKYNYGENSYLRVENQTRKL